MNCAVSKLWLWCLPGMWWPSVHWWTPRRTHRPSSSGTSWPDRRREASTARALHTGPYSSEYLLSKPHFTFYIVLTFAAPAEIMFILTERIRPQVEPWWEVLCQDDHRHAEHLWDSSKKILRQNVDVFLKKCGSDIKSMFLILSVYGLARQEES